jgi:hypothetical protein
MFDCSCAEPKFPHAKYAVTLLGPGTLLLQPGGLLAEVMASRDDWYKDELRDELAGKLVDCERIPVGKTGEEVIKFSWGQDDSPVHSEPDMSGGDRVFMSVMFGSNEELRVMCDWRAEPFGEATFANE